MTKTFDYSFLSKVCLAALASAEADADAFYNTYGYGLNHGLGYTNAYAAGYGINAYAAPMRYSGAYGYAAPAASAAITVRGYGTPATVGSNLPYGYAASGRYVADSVGAVHIAKREAEAEPEADADAYYGTYGYSNLGYSSYAAPAAYSGYSTIVRPAISYAARPIVSTGYGINRYSAIARPAIYSRGFYGKREAEAEPEAEADAQYSAYGNYGNYGYSNLGYSAIARPAVYSTIARPAISSYAARPLVSSYAASPLVSSYAARPLVSTGYGYGRYGVY